MEALLCAHSLRYWRMRSDDRCPAGNVGRCGNMGVDVERFVRQTVHGLDVEDAVRRWRKDGAGTATQPLNY